MKDMTDNKETDAIGSTLRERFVATALGKLDIIDGAIGEIAAGRINGHVAEIKRTTHTLKGMAGSFGFMSVTHISEAFEVFLGDSEDTGVINVVDAERYSRTMRAIIESGEEPDDAETGEIISGLSSATHHLN